MRDRFARVRAAMTRYLLAYFAVTVALGVRSSEPLQRWHLDVIFGALWVLRVWEKGRGDDC